MEPTFGPGPADRGQDLALVAYDAADGTESWVRRYPGPAEGETVEAVIGPRGRIAYLVGTDKDKKASTGRDFVTVAYRVGTGRRLWSARYDGPSHGQDSAGAAAPDRGVLYVSRESGDGDGQDFTTIAYRNR